MVSEKELLATTGSRLFRWHDDAEWTEIDTPFSTHGNFAELGGATYLSRFGLVAQAQHLRGWLLRCKQTLLDCLGRS